MKVLRLSALRTIRLYYPGNICGTHMCSKLVDPKAAWPEKCCRKISKPRPSVCSAGCSFACFIRFGLGFGNYIQKFRFFSHTLAWFLRNSNFGKLYSQFSTSFLHTVQFEPRKYSVKLDCVLIYKRLCLTIQLQPAD
jgi:hypothetical protein